MTTRTPRPRRLPLRAMDAAVLDPEPVEHCLIGHEALPADREDWRRFVPICDEHLDEVRRNSTRTSWRALMQMVARINTVDVDPTWLEEASLAEPLGEPFTDERRGEFLMLMAEGNTVTYCCQKVGVSFTTVLKHRRDNPTFAEEFQLAYEQGTQVYEQELFRSGVKGRLKPVWYKGEKVGTERVYSDSNLQFALKGRRPQVYREGQSTIVNLTQETGGATDLDLSKLSDEELEQYERLLRKASGD